MKNLNTKYLLYTGMMIPIIFWVTTIICSFLLGNYNHLTRMVSELGELGTKTQFIFTIGLTLCGILTIPFVIGSYKVCRLVGLSPVPVLIILFYATIAGPAIFPYPLQLHGILGIPAILILFSPLLSLFLWKGKTQLPYLKLISILSFLLIMLGFSVYFNSFLGDYFGLKQRFFHLGWSLWFVYLSYSFIRVINPKVVKAENLPGN